MFNPNLDYFNIVSKYKNVLDAIDTFYNNGYRISYLTKSYINSILTDINNYIDNVTSDNYIQLAEFIHNLRNIQRDLFAIKRINQFFTDETTQEQLDALESQFDFNFVFPN